MKMMNECPICKSSYARTFDDSRQPFLLICENCRHLYWNCTPSQSEIDRYYNSTYTPNHNQSDIQESNRKYYRSHVEELVKVVGKDRSKIYLADFGCSYPVLLEEAMNLGVGRVLGVELDQSSRDYGKARDIPMMTPADFFNQVPESTLDIIRFSHVLEHLIDPAETLALAVSKLAADGLLYLTQPSFPVFKPQKNSYLLKDSVYPSHLHFFSPISLARMLDRMPIIIFKFFTVTNADQTHAECATLLDLSYAEQNLKAWEELGEAGRGYSSNYPIYCGENSALYAFKAPPPVSKLSHFIGRARELLFAGRPRVR